MARGLGRDPTFAAVAALLLRDDRNEYHERDGRYRVAFHERGKAFITTAPESESLLNWRAVVDLIPGHYTTSSGLPPSPVVEFPEGRCYLAAYADGHGGSAFSEFGRRPHAARVYADLLDGNSPRAPYRGGLTIVFGTQASVSASDKFLAHVYRSNSVCSGELLALVPLASRLGALTDDPEEKHAQPNIPAPTSLGVVFDPLVCRRQWRALSLAAHSGVGTTANGFTYGEVDPYAGPILAWGDDKPIVRFTSLAVKLIPRPGAARACVTFHYTWYPGSRAAPTSRADFENSPGHQVHVLAPASVNGAAPSLVCPCVPEAGVSLQMVPAPHYGGSARFAYRACSWNVSADETDALAPGEELFDLYLEVTATARA